jgi:iron complex outermembrane recepter protein
MIEAIKRWIGILLLANVLCAQSVIVTGTWTPVPLEEADRAVRQLPVDNETLLLSSSWNDLLRLLPSLDLQQRAPNGVLSDLAIRGGTFGQTLVLLNGLRINDAQTGHFSMNLPVPLDAVERIEVLQGAGSLFYGSDAVGGVVNVITGIPETSTLRLRTAYGSFGTQQQRVDLGWTKKRWSQRLVFSRDLSTGFLANRDYRNLSSSAESHVRTGIGNTSVLLAYADRPFGAEAFYGNYPSWERTKTWWASVRQELGSRTDLALAFRRNTDLFVLYRYEPQRYTNRHVSEDYQISIRRTDPLGGILRLHYGLEGFRDDLESTNLGLRTRNRGAAYLGVDGRTVKRFSFTAGGRQEIYTGRGRQFSPTAAGAYWLSSHAKLRANVSHAFRLPTFTDLYYRDPANIGNPYLRPERAWSYEGGLDWNAGASVQGNLTIFQRRDFNGIDYVRQSSLEPWRATNVNQLRFTGAEVGVVWVWRHQRSELQHTLLRGAQAALNGLQSKYVFNYPTGSTVAGWQGPLPLRLIGRARLGRIDRVQRSPYTVFDLYLARRDSRVSPFAQFTNLTNTRYEEIPGVPVAGRAVLVGVEMRLWP